MRQGGYTPKNHNSGVYWVRAQAGKGKKNTMEDNRESPKWYHYLVAICLFFWLLLL